MPEHDISTRDEKERYLLHENTRTNSGYTIYLEAFIRETIPHLCVLQSLSKVRILDYGSGPEPVLAALLGQKGYDVTLHDPFFGPAEIIGDNFDCVIMHETAEHFRKPAVEFQRTSALLAPGGILAIRTMFAPDTAEAFGKWWYRQDSTHRFFYSEGTFGAIADGFGFERLSSNGKDTVIFRKNGATRS